MRYTWSLKDVQGEESAHDAWFRVEWEEGADDAWLRVEVEEKRYTDGPVKIL